MRQAMLSRALRAVCSAAISTGTKRPILLYDANGAANCGFQTQAQCERARLGVANDIYRPNPRYKRR
jgi:hypothetical protein